ncbi:hypothetical protein EHS13_02310 [Paenibacillus psychroresistens]|uniref:Uncharacterized protein n=1 Tax=Paenibacillus psychroresistens TaxID=1778678 RepID=A0A6B8RXS2_9BACL|nr:hypothetical protein EHS13_02310 [Paenibacillus psychroresistens]
MDYIRDYTMYAAIFGIFSFNWFGWAQERPRQSWRLYLGIASGIALLVGLIGVYLSIKNWHEASALADSGAFKDYLIYVYTEFFVAGVGAFLLIKFKHKDYIAPWIAFIVGVHFFALVDVFQDSSLNILASVLIIVAAASIFLSKKLNVANSAITGIGAGTILFCFAVLGLVRFLMV